MDGDGSFELGQGENLWSDTFPTAKPLQKALAAPSVVLQSDLLFAEQRSGALSVSLSLFLIVPSSPLFAFGTDSSRTGPSSSSPTRHSPREQLCTFPRKRSSLRSLRPRTVTALSLPWEETQPLQNDSRLLHCHIHREPSPRTVDPGGTNSSGCLLPGRQHRLRNPPG